MAAIIQMMIDKIRDKFNPYLYNKRVSPYLGIIEQIVHMERSLFVFGMLCYPTSSLFL